MRKFIIKNGEALIELLAWVCIITTVLYGLSSGIKAIFIIPIGIISTILIFYLIFCLMDIKDSLNIIAERKLKNKED